MSSEEIIVHGTVTSDGTLELDQDPSLAAGRVTVILRRELEAPPGEGWWPYMQRVRSERESAGCHFLNEGEMDLQLQWLREDEDRIERVRREMAIEKRIAEHG